MLGGGHTIDPCSGDNKKGRRAVPIAKSRIRPHGIALLLLFLTLCLLGYAFPASASDDSVLSVIRSAAEDRDADYGALAEELGPLEESDLNAVGKAIVDADFRVRKAAVSLLKALRSPETAPHLVTALRDESKTIRELAVEGLILVDVLGAVADDVVDVEAGIVG